MIGIMKSTTASDSGIMTYLLGLDKRTRKGRLCQPERD